MRQGLLLRLREHKQVGHNSARGARELFLIPNDVPGDHDALGTGVIQLPAFVILRITQEETGKCLGLEALSLITIDMGVGTASKDT
jgi:hypothetical protein